MRRKEQALAEGALDVLKAASCKDEATHPEEFHKSCKADCLTIIIDYHHAPENPIMFVRIFCHFWWFLSTKLLDFLAVIF